MNYSINDIVEISYFGTNETFSSLPYDISQNKNLDGLKN